MRLGYVAPSNPVSAPAKRSACPKCRGELVFNNAFGRREYLCPAKHGRGYSAAAVRHWLREEFQADFEKCLRQERRPGQRNCAHCGKPAMIATLLSVPMEVCDPCSHVWLTEAAMERLPWKDAAARAAGGKMPLKLEMAPMSAVGLPLQDPFTDLEVPKGEFPTATIALLLACLMVTIWFWASPREDLYVFSPDHPLNGFGLSLILPLFSHADKFHILGNAYFLFFSGRALEAVFGSRRLVALYFFSGFGGHLFSALSSSQGGLGASGAISGLLMALVLTQPQAKYRLGAAELMPVAPGLFSLSIRIPLWLWFGGWLFTNFVWMQYQIAGGMVRIGYAAHVGGAITGMLLVLAGFLPPKPANA